MTDNEYIELIKAYLVDNISTRYEALRHQMIHQHGYNKFCDLQSEAFKQMFGKVGDPFHMVSCAAHEGYECNCHD